MSDDRSAEKPTSEWVTGDEPMTGPQRSYLETLAREAGETLPEHLTKAEASELIEHLQHVTGRGGERGHEQETLGERVEEEGIVDQQAVLLDQIDDPARSGPDDHRP